MPKYNYIDIKNDIKKSGKLCYWFDHSGNNILTGNNKNITTNQMMKLDKKEGVYYRFIITFHTGKKPGQGGPIGVKVQEWKQDDTFHKVHGYKNGIIWFDRNYLERMGWKDNYIDKIYEIISRKNFEFKIRIYVFHQLL
jgi:hypothetical protein